MITLYNSDAITEICTLNNCLECLVTEEENGVFELELIYSISSNNFRDIQNNKVVKAKASDELGEQLFRIYYVSNEIDGKIYVKAQHITYDLIDNFVENVTCTKSTCQQSFQTMLSKCQHSHKFKGYSDIEHTGTYNLSRVNALEAILGTRGSLLDVYGNGAKLKRDNYNIYLNKTRGKNNGVTISYSKNITGYKREIDETGVITCIYPFAKVQKELGEGDTIEEIIVLPERFVNSKYINNYPHPKILAIDYSEREVKDIASLRTQANNYFQETQKDIPNVNYKIEFIYLHQTVEYEGNNLKALELVGMGDTVTVIDERIGMNVEANVIKTVFNVLTNRYESIELGRFKNSINDIIGDLENNVDNALTQVNNMYVNFEVLNDKIISEVSKLEGDVKSNTSLIEQTDSYIKSTVSDLNGKYTSIKQTVDDIDVTGMVTFNDLKGNGTTTINGANIQTGTLNGNSIIAGTIEGSDIKAGTIACDMLSTPAGHDPVINLFNGTCQIDARRSDGGSKGEAIRLKYNDSNYVYVSNSGIDLYNNGYAVMNISGNNTGLNISANYKSQGTLKFRDDALWYVDANGNVNEIEYKYHTHNWDSISGRPSFGTNYGQIAHGDHNHSGVYAPYSHTHNYASSSHNHDGSTIYPYQVVPSSTGGYGYCGNHNGSRYWYVVATEYIRYNSIAGGVYSLKSNYSNTIKNFFGNYSRITNNRGVEPISSYDENIEEIYNIIYEENEEGKIFTDGGALASYQSQCLEILVNENESLLSKISILEQENKELKEELEQIKASIESLVSAIENK